MHNIPFDVIAALGALVYAINIFIDNLVGKEYGSAIKQAKTWVVGLIVVFIAVRVQYTEGWTVNGIPLRNLTLWSQVLLGLTGSSFANTLFHLGQRIDSSSSGDTPTIAVRRKDRHNRTTTHKAA